MKGYLYFASVTTLLAGCAYGVTPFEEQPHDGGVVHADAGAPKDAAPDAKEASVVDAHVDPPDVQQTQCASLPMATGIAACDSCLGASCCAEDQTCGYDQDCMAFTDCLYQCYPVDGGAPDQQCELDCQSQYPNGASELDALDGCMQQSCSTSCLGP